MTGSLSTALQQHIGDALAGRTVLITGGAGFIGSHLARALLSVGAAVRIIDDLSSGHRHNLPEGLDTFVHASILDEDALNEAAAGCDLIFHQAAMVSVPESVQRPADCVRTNILGTRLVLSAASRAGVRRVLFAASAAAYGNEPTLPSTEDTAPSAWSPYAASKVAGELLLESAARCDETDTVSLRYFNIFGPRQDPKSPYAAVISAFMDRLLGGTDPTVYGDGEQTRDFTYIDNVVLANLLAAARPEPLNGAIINIGTGHRSSLLDVLNSMGRTLRREINPRMQPPRLGDVRHSVADITKAKRLLRYEPIVDLEEGLARTLEWASAELD